MKLCKDCKHFVRSYGSRKELCGKIGLSVVDGSPATYCCVVRLRPDSCGKDAVLFEQKEPQEWTDGIMKYIVGAVIGAVMVAPLFPPLFK